MRVNAFGTGVAIALTSLGLAASSAAAQTVDEDQAVNACIAEEEREQPIADDAQLREIVACVNRESARQLNAQTPLRIDEGTILDSVEAVGLQLTYRVTIDVDGAEVTDGDRAAIIEATRASVCESDDIRQTMSHGGSYAYVWRDRAGRTVGETVIADC